MPKKWRRSGRSTGGSPPLLLEAIFDEGDEQLLLLFDRIVRVLPNDALMNVLAFTGTDRWGWLTTSVDVGTQVIFDMGFATPLVTLPLFTSAPAAASIYGPDGSQWPGGSFPITLV